MQVAGASMSPAPTLQTVRTGSPVHKELPDSDSASQCSGNSHIEMADPGFPEATLLPGYHCSSVATLCAQSMGEVSSSTSVAGPNLDEDACDEVFVQPTEGDALPSPELTAPVPVPLAAKPQNVLPMLSPVAGQVLGACSPHPLPRALNEAQQQGTVHLQV